ncbi:hypothetical protein C2845_PM06G24910 [Panicum miliaceum]|uniref:FHA domain-containing protein n=1 Tax=Panicum miliaceum TaxID=4540 RepID=A0A3L6R763_PANMI|nr:hypothetical protein C2845_PM06G24910 [Panicum miliaceum]
MRRREEHSQRSRSPASGREPRGTPPRKRSPPERRKSSPVRARSPPAKPSASHRDRERSPPREKAKERARSPRSPAKASLSQRERSPPREKVKDQRVRSPKHAREQSRSPSPARRRGSMSPSPRTKRLRRAQGEREAAQVTDSDRRKSSHREERDTGGHREPDDGRDASRDRKVERETAQVTNGDRHKSSHREDRDSGGKHREHDEGRDASRDRKAEREDARDKKSDRDDGKDHSRDRRAGRDDRSGASKESLSSRDDDRHDSRGGRPDRDDWKAASSREQWVDRTEKRDSIREKLTDREESNGGSGRSSRRGRSVSPDEHRHRGRHESHPSPRVSRSAARTEVSGDIRPFTLYLSISPISTLEEVKHPDNVVMSAFNPAVDSMLLSLQERSGDPDALARMNAATEALEAKQKQKPSFELSGKLAEETNRVAGVNLLYSEPPEARKSENRWRLYVFKGGEPLNEKEQPDGMMAKKVRPYLMDLDSTNGTFINENRIEPRRYYELFEKDTIKFGNTRRQSRAVRSSRGHAVPSLRRRPWPTLSAPRTAGCDRPSSPRATAARHPWQHLTRAAPRKPRNAAVHKREFPFAACAGDLVVLSLGGSAAASLLRSPPSSLLGDGGGGADEAGRGVRAIPLKEADGADQRRVEGLPPSSSALAPAAEPALPEQEAAGAALLRAVAAEVRWEEFGAAEGRGGPSQPHAGGGEGGIRRGTTGGVKGKMVFSHLS